MKSENILMECTSSSDETVVARNQENPIAK
jgi:hypothetical protein